MSKEVLSQDEVDALMHGISGEATSDETDHQPEEGVRPYDLVHQERIVRGRMPTLEVINERFMRLLRIGMFNLMRRSPDISVGPIRVIKYAEFVRNLVVPTNLNLVQVKPLRGTALFIFEPQLVFSVVDTMFGGGHLHTRIEGRDFTPTEQRIIQRLLQVVFNDYQKAWESVYPLQLEYMRSEMHTQFANIATPGEIVLACSFNLDFGGNGGELHICMPYAMIEPIRDLLSSSMQGEGMEPDKRWVKALSKEIQLAEVGLVAQFACIPLSMRELLALRVGDVLRFDMPQSVCAEVDGVPIFECKYGRSNGKYAIKVDRIIAASKSDQDQGKSHAE